MGYFRKLAKMKKMVNMIDQWANTNYNQES